MRLSDPTRKLLPLNNYILPETVFRKENFYVSVACRAYFGSSVRTTYNWEETEKVFKIGKRRFLIWNKDCIFFENLGRVKDRQFLELIVKVESNIFINLFNTNNSNIYRPEKIKVRLDEED